MGVYGLLKHKFKFVFKYCFILKNKYFFRKKKGNLVLQMNKKR